jgi:hypothetical protein
MAHAFFGGQSLALAATSTSLPPYLTGAVSLVIGALVALTYLFGWLLGRTGACCSAVLSRRREIVPIHQ